ncbi:hypothetical protein BCR33DRAFT_801108 [Rhizoclosmatium globosum]|uniref:P-loop containing nucleoside triphosphate hydrolase protein n=1 Tax=Rhizoclosmatium globosum TaxID=329046 RepID=A0A1Y2D2M9_9FUNG|nr:hypothetical protein BCR33DRAFT_801108 [Rhizoclosmatium globosum]|eukprot:ORY53553.1 hypothetical protein BCR33DRAFT_801108 [Rhizoclosmatium globosum]
MDTLAPRTKRAAATKAKYVESGDEFDEFDSRAKKEAAADDADFVDDVDGDADADADMDFLFVEDVDDGAFDVKKRSNNILANGNAGLRDAFLWEHRAVFLPLLPEGSVNHFTHIEKLFKDRNVEIIPKRPVETPKMVTATLKDYQLKGLEFLAWLVDNGMNGILGDEMGLGKTLQTISMLSYMKESGKSGPYLVVCPLSCCRRGKRQHHLHWYQIPLLTYNPTGNQTLDTNNEIHSFHGPMNERASIKRRCTKEKFDIYLTTYEQLVAEAGWFRVSRGWRCVVLDEGHKIKNDKANMSAVVYSIPSQYRFILTGTPLQNNLQELWALLHYLYPLVFTQQTSRYFLDAFNLQRGKYNTDGIEAARKLLDLIMLRRLKTHVDLSIPPKEELIRGPEDPTVGNGSSSTFDSTREVMQYAQQNQKGDWAKLMNLLLQLRKVCNHPYILPNSEPEPIPYARLDGRTSRPRRNLDIRLFQRADSPYQVFLISTKAGGLGINLTTADTVIMIDSDWNPQNDLQAMARSHRIGQTKNVKVYRTICRDTVEEQMLTRLQKKLFLSLKVTAGGRQQSDGDDAMPSLSKDDLLTIFRYGTKTITNDAEDDPHVFLAKSADEILQNSRDHAAKLLELVSDNVEAPTQFELEGFESVKSRFFEGKEHIQARKLSKNNSDIAAEWNNVEKRVRVQRTVKVGRIWF